jgi:hypothetical protein
MPIPLRFGAAESRQPPRLSFSTTCAATAVAALSMVAACNAPLWPVLNATPQTSARAAYICALGQARALGYTSNMPDSGGVTRFLARRSDSTVTNHRLPEIDRIDQLNVEVSPSDTSRASMSVEARTVSYQMTRRGPGEERMYASKRVQADAEQVVKACGGSGG